MTGLTNVTPLATVRGAALNFSFLSLFPLTPTLSPPHPNPLAPSPPLSRPRTPYPLPPPSPASLPFLIPPPPSARALSDRRVHRFMRCVRWCARFTRAAGSATRSAPGCHRLRAPLPSDQGSCACVQGVSTCQYMNKCMIDVCFRAYNRSFLAHPYHQNACCARG